jgi:hypothetical protein
VLKIRHVVLNINHLFPFASLLVQLVRGLSCSPPRTGSVMVGLGRLGVWLGWLAGTAAGFSCSPGNLAVYRLELRTFWSEERFPKQYPQWRPPPQWSKTIGETIIISCSRLVFAAVQ